MYLFTYQEWLSPKEQLQMTTCQDKYAWIVLYFIYLT